VNPPPSRGNVVEGGGKRGRKHLILKAAQKRVTGGEHGERKLRLRRKEGRKMKINTPN